MSFAVFVVICLVVGVIVYLVQHYTPIDQKFKTLILWAGVIICVIALLRALGLWPLGDVGIPKLTK